MAWQLLAMWVVVVTTVVWFIRDERRRRADREIERAARYYAHAPRFRHAARSPAPEPVTPPPVRRTSLLRNDQASLDRFLNDRLARRFSVSLKR